MMDTSASLLQRLQATSAPDDWQRLVELYTPLLRDWLRRAGVPLHDAEDLAQDVLGVVVRELPHFRKQDRAGSFRAWLRTILTNRMRNYWRSRHSIPVATGNRDVAALLDQLENPTSELSQLWDREHDRHVTQRLLAAVEPEFEPKTWRAFQRVVLDGARPAAVANELGLSVNSVWLAKSRILHRLREAMRDFTG